MQLRAAGLGALEAVQSVARRAHAAQMPDAVSLAFSVLSALTAGSTENSVRYAQVVEADPLLLELCSSGGPSSEARVGHH